MSTIIEQIRSDLTDIIHDGTVGFGPDTDNAMAQLNALIDVAEAAQAARVPAPSGWRFREGIYDAGALPALALALDRLDQLNPQEGTKGITIPSIDFDTAPPVALAESRREFGGSVVGRATPQCCAGGDL